MGGTEKKNLSLKSLSYLGRKKKREVSRIDKQNPYKQ